MKYSLRSLMIVVTLVCVVVGGRIEYLRRRAVYHEQEATNWYRYNFANFENDTPPSFSEKEAAESMAFLSHSSLAEEYRRAVFRPWLIVDEGRFPVPDYPAPAPNPPNP